MRVAEVESCHGVCLCVCCSWCHSYTGRCAYYFGLYDTVDVQLLVLLAAWILLSCNDTYDIPPLFPICI